jgi:hypothetical protein
MTALQFAERLKQAIADIPDTDGEPGYFAEVITLKDRTVDTFMLVIITDAELPEEQFEVTVRKKG